MHTPPYDDQRMWVGAVDSWSNVVFPTAAKDALVRISVQASGPWGVESEDAGVQEPNAKLAQSVEEVDLGLKTHLERRRVPFENWCKRICCWDVSATGEQLPVLPCAGVPIEALADKFGLAVSQAVDQADEIRG